MVRFRTCSHEKNNSALAMSHWRRLHLEIAYGATCDKGRGGRIQGRHLSVTANANRERSVTGWPRAVIHLTIIHFRSDALLGPRANARPAALGGGPVLKRFALFLLRTRHALPRACPALCCARPADTSACPLCSAAHHARLVDDVLARGGELVKGKRKRHCFRWGRLLDLELLRDVAQKNVSKWAKRKTEERSTWPKYSSKCLVFQSVSVLRLRNNLRYDT